MAKDEVDKASRARSDEHQDVRPEEGVLRSRVPNAESRKAMREAESGEGVVKFDGIEELFKDLGI